MKMYHTYLLVYILIIGIYLPCFLSDNSKNESQINESYKEDETNKYTYTAYIIAGVALVIMCIPAAVGWFLYYKLRKKTTVYDEEKAIEQSMPPKSKSTKRTKTKKKKKKKKNQVNKPMETTMNVEKLADVSIKPSPTEEQIQSKEIPQRPSEVKKNRTFPEEECMGPDHEEYVVPRDFLTIENEHLVPDNVCVSPTSSEFHQSVKPTQKGTPSKPKYRRLTILEWIDETTDEEDDEQTDMEQTLQAPEKDISQFTAVNIVPQVSESQKEISVVPETNMASPREFEIQIEDDDDDEEEWVSKPTDDIINKKFNKDILVTVQRKDVVDDDDDADDDYDEEEWRRNQIDLKKHCEDVKNKKYKQPPEVEVIKIGIEDYDDEEWISKPVDLKKLSEDIKNKKFKKHYQWTDIQIFEEDGDDPIDLSDLSSDTVQMLQEHIQNDSFKEGEYRVMRFEDLQNTIYVTNLPRAKAKMIIKQMRTAPVESVQDYLKALEEPERKPINLDSDEIVCNYPENTNFREPESLNILIFEDDREDPIELSSLPKDTVEMITEHIR
ncbi:hypothetical protein XENTR_v10001524 [Xenopus tropicalis]|nr:hypothetical protein XENTR_v10001524 [Xenopus tropicalis]